MKSFNPNPFLEACLSGNIDYVRSLLNSGVDVNAKDHHNFTALHIASFRGFLEIVQELIKYKANINGEFNNEKKVESPLHLAVQNNHYRIVEFLLENGANPNIVDANNDTPLHYSAWNNSLESLALLLNYGANITTRNFDDKTPLHHGAMKDNLNTIVLLLKNGANPDTRDDFLKKPQFYAQDSELRELLEDFNFKKNLKESNPSLVENSFNKLKSYGLQNRIDYFKEKDFLSLLVNGTGNASEKVATLKLLQKEGFDIYKTNRDGNNLLSLALIKRDKNLIKEIFKEENGFDLESLLINPQIKSIEKITSYFSCLSTGTILKITSVESQSIPPVEVNLSKELADNLHQVYTKRQSITAKIGYASSK